MFQKEFIRQLLNEFRPDFEQLIRQVIETDKKPEPLIVGYAEAGRLIGTTYEGIRKLVKKGKVQASRRSGRRVGITMTEINRYVQDNKLDGQNRLDEGHEAKADNQQT